MVLFYGYAKCATCRRAKALLQQLGVALKAYDITVTPPSKTVLQAIVRAGTYRLVELFNRSGELYRQLRMAERLKTVSEAEALQLLATHGKLIKRPVVTDGVRHTVGGDEAVLRRVWGPRGSAHLK